MKNLKEWFLDLWSDIREFVREIPNGLDSYDPMEDPYRVDEEDYTDVTKE